MHLEPLLPPKPSPGRPPKDHRTILDALLWLGKTAFVQLAAIRIWLQERLALSKAFAPKARRANEMGLSAGRAGRQSADPSRPSVFPAQGFRQDKAP